MLVVVMLVFNDAPFRCNLNIINSFLSGMQSLPLSTSAVYINKLSTALTLVKDSQEGIGDNLTKARGEGGGNVSILSGRDAFLS
jgi:hypothetical protein